jgi:hypothetical protein
VRPHLAQLIMVTMLVTSANVVSSSAVAVAPEPSVVASAERLHGARGAPGVSSPYSGPADHHDVFETGPHHAVVQWHFEFGSGYTSRTSLGGFARGGVAVASFSEGIAGMVLIRDERNDIRYRERRADGTWDSWQKLRARATSRPEVSTSDDGDLVVLIRGRDGTIYERTRDQDGWSPVWSRVGIRLVGAPASSGGAVYFRGLDNSLWLAIRNDDGTWSAPRREPALPGGRHVTSEPGIGPYGVVVVRGSRGGAAWSLEHDTWSSLEGHFLKNAGFAGTSYSDGFGTYPYLYGRGSDNHLYVLGDSGWQPVVLSLGP